MTDKRLEEHLLDSKAVAKIYLLGMKCFSNSSQCGTGFMTN